MKNTKGIILWTSLFLVIFSTFSPLLEGTALCRYVVPNHEAHRPMTMHVEHVPGMVATQSPTGFTPAQIRKAYNLPSSGGSGTIAIIVAGNDPTVVNDLTVFSEQFGLPLPNSSNFVFEIHPMSSSVYNDTGNWAAETSIDVQWAHAIAPNARILLVEAVNEQPNSNMFDAIDYAANRSDVVAVSMSWSFPASPGWPQDSEYPGETSDDSHFTSNHGVVFFVASGDSAWPDYEYPACSPNVTAVGGTVLTLNPDNSVASETGWSYSGGCISHYEPLPNYQNAINVWPILYHRGTPDVSYNAVNYSVYESFNPADSGWFNENGTSCGTPQWAAIESLGHLGASNSRFYRIATSPFYSSDFRDITIGSNNQSCLVGWDYVTGLGSPLTFAFKGGLGDINLDGTVNVLDEIILGRAFLSTFGTSNWNSAADLNNDSTVNILDAIILSNNWAKNYAYGSASGVSGQPSSAGAMTESGTIVLLDPNQVIVFKGDNFTVNVNIANVTNLLGWEFKLYWNSTVLNCTSASVVTPTIWQGNTQDDGPGLQANYNSTNGRFWQAEAANYPAPPFNGSTTIATLTFQALQPGTTSLTLTDTVLGDNAAQPIACSLSSGSVTVYSGRYMRSDTQTINGLTAYVLNMPESNSSGSDTQCGDTPVAYWGVRAWVRHSNGTETEIILGGQTGTPTAIVTRSGGSGIQSATVTVAQTALQPTDSLVIRVYTQVGTDSSWGLSATFTTEQLQAITLQNATWTMYYYTYANWNRYAQTETATLYWGTATYNTRIQNLQYT
jgi:hypothetical protein